MAERAPLDLAPSEGLERTSGEGRVLLLACRLFYNGGMRIDMFSGASPFGHTEVDCF